MTLYSEVTRSSQRSGGYVNDIIIAAFEEDAKESAVWEAAEFLGGVPVGKLSGVPIYQIQVENSAEEDLQQKCEAIQDSGIEGLFAVLLDPVFEVSEDIESEANGLEKSGVTDWRSLIYADEALKLAGGQPGVKIGIVDTGFDFDHPDLKVTAHRDTKQYQKDHCDNEGWRWHGTVVAALAGGTHSDEMQGMAPEGTEIFCQEKSMYIDEAEEDDKKWLKMSMSSAMNGIMDCLAEDCMVINFSQGLGLAITEEDVADIELSREYASSYLYLIDRIVHKKFLIVQAAGNNGNVLDKSEIGFFTGLTSKIVENGITKKLYKAYNDKLDFGTPYQSWDDYLELFQSQILVVGNCTESEVYVNSKGEYSSNYGPYVDVYAPGVDLKVPTGENHGYRTGAVGSSYSAPQVAGVVSMIWGKYSTLSSSQVKDCIIGGTLNEIICGPETDSNGRNGIETCWMLDAEQAMKYAALLYKDGSYGKMPNMLEARGACISDQNECKLRLGVFVSDRHLNLTDNWQFRLRYSKKLSDSSPWSSWDYDVYGGFYHIQEDRSGNLWLKCRELPAYLMDGLSEGENIKYHYCRHLDTNFKLSKADIYSDAVDSTFDIALYQVCEPGVVPTNLPINVVSDIKKYRDSSDWLIFGQTDAGEWVVYYGN